MAGIEGQGRSKHTSRLGGGASAPADQEEEVDESVEEEEEEEGENGWDEECGLVTAVCCDTTAGSSITKADCFFLWLSSSTEGVNFPLEEINTVSSS